MTNEAEAAAYASFAGRSRQSGPSFINSPDRSA